MPMQIVNRELYQDRTVQNWHRTVFPANAWAIDLDLMGACSRCREPLYLIESTTNPDKPVTILRRLAVKADLPALVIQHDRNVVVRGRLIHPHSHDLANEEQVTAILTLIRAEHAEGSCQ